MKTSKRVYIKMLQTKTLDELYEMVDYHKEIKENLTEKEFEALDLMDGLSKDLQLINNEIFNKITA